MKQRALKDYHKLLIDALYIFAKAVSSRMTTNDDLFPNCPSTDEELRGKITECEVLTLQYKEVLETAKRILLKLDGCIDELKSMLGERAD